MLASPVTIAGLAGTMIEVTSETRSTVSLVFFGALFLSGYAVSAIAAYKDRQIIEHKYELLSSELETLAIVSDENLYESVRNAEKETERVSLEKHLVNISR